MKKSRIVSLLLALCMALTLIPFSAFAAEDVLTIHVSATAKSRGNGSLELPYATIEDARLALRDINHKRKRVEVLIHAGEYNFTKVVKFDANDSGSEDFPVVYKAAGDGDVIFTGATKLKLTDFTTVTDKSVYNRLPASSRDKVGQLSLESYGISKEIFNLTSNTTRVANKKLPRVPQLYLNGISQEIARYPNAGYLKLNTIINSGPTKAGDPGPYGSFLYETKAPENWKDVSQAFVCGFLAKEYSIDWAPIAKVDTQSKTITLGLPTGYGMLPGGRWYAKNILEELDIPGEYFVDYETMMLYYYPTKKFTSSDTLELSTYNDYFFRMDDVTNVEFNGIKFRHNLKDAIRVYTSSNITFRNCEFFDIGAVGILLEGRNCLVEACTFQEVGNNAVRFYGGGDWETYTPSNNRIANNHFWYCGKLGEQGSGTMVDIGRDNYLSASIGDVCENNLFHTHPSSGAVVWGGMDNIIRYNEMWEMKRDSADGGMVYSGRKFNEFGNVVEYNYMHDFGPAFTSRYTVVGVYFDDHQSGQTARNNIIVPNNKDNQTVTNISRGSYNELTGNITVRARSGVAASDNNSAPFATAYATLTDPVKTPKAVQDRWPQIGTIKALIDSNPKGTMPVVGNIVKNNLHVDIVAGISIADTVAAQGDIENNPVTDDLSVFVDAENHDWRLTTEAMERFGFPETMINENNFDMSLIGINEEVFDVQTPESPFRLIYPQNGQTGVSRNGAFLKWERAPFSDQFDYVVARDPELTDIVESGTTYENFVELENLENSQTYYYKVWAKCLSKQIGNRWESMGVPYMFTTAAYDVLDQTFLKEEIQKLEAAKAAIVVGDNVGEYRPEAITDADDMLAEAMALTALTKGDQEDIYNMTLKVRNFTGALGGYRHNGHSKTPVSGTWLSAKTNAVITPTDGGVKIENEDSSTIAYLDTMLSDYEIQHFKIKTDFGGSLGFALRQLHKELEAYATGNQSYLIIIKPDIIEFQKYSLTSATRGVVTTYPNDFVKADTWHDIEFGAVDVMGGVVVLLKVDGKTVFEYYDNDNPVLGAGYLTMRRGAPGGCVEIKEVDSVPTEQFEFSVSDAIEKENSTIYNYKSDVFTSEGNWENGPEKGEEHLEYALSEDANAKAVYTIADDKMTSYSFSYYHTPIEGGDKNAKLTLRFYTPIAAGERVVEKEIDFSSGTEGWVELGSIQCLSVADDAKIAVEFSGSGEGKAVAPAIKTKVVSNEEVEFSKLFYDYSQNLLMMQINNDKAFNMMSPVTIPDAVPFIDNGRTLVPLRFVSEAFGATVTWDDENRKVYIENGDTKLEFTIDSAQYLVNSESKTSDVPAKIVNGRTMVPLRVTAESLGKKVFWNETHSIIFIADSFAFAESDSARFDLAAKGFQGGF